MEFESLNEYYNYLENDFTFSYLDLNTDKYLMSLKSRTEDEITRKHCSYELFFADFSIQEGLLVPKYKQNDNSYPTLELFDDDFAYIKTQAATIKNPKYKAKYNHLLWLSPYKHILFAQQAIENYLLLIQNSSFSIDDDLERYSFENYFKNLFVLCQTINYKKDDIILYFVSLLETDKICDFTKCLLMKFIIENSKKNDTTITQTFFDYSKKEIENLNPDTLECHLNLLIILSQKLSISPYEFHEKLGDYYISELKKQNQHKSFIVNPTYTKALEEYKKANNKSKIEETAILLEDAKKKLDMKKVSFKIKDKKLLEQFNQWWKNVNSKTSYLIENCESKDIYDYLITTELFPKAEKLNEEVNSPFLDSVTNITFDINKNISKKTGKRKTYSYHVDILSVEHIWLVFLKGIKSGKISFESIIDYLKNNSWYGQNFTYLDINNEIQGFNWIELLSPSLQSFFVQIEIDIKTNSHNSQGYILAIDSLTLKFEGLLREFSRMIGAQTIEIKENSTEERISFDKLLDNEKLKTLIREDDIAFFKFLFTSNGINLRNNIAHSFFNTKNYTNATMLLLIVALLRLGGFIITNESK